MSKASPLNNRYPELDNLRRMHPDYAQSRDKDGNEVVSLQWGDWLLERMVKDADAVAKIYKAEKEIELER